jgi:hypothetical protein
MKRIDEDDKITIVFDSLADLTRTLVHNKTRHSVSNTFMGTSCIYTWEQAIEMLRFGWKEGAERITEIANSFSGKLDVVEEKAFEIEYDVVGDYIDMGRFMSGEPECFGRIDIVEREKQSITVKVSASFAAHVKSSTIERRGAAILSLIEKLRRNNHVKLIIENKTYFNMYNKELTIQCHIDTHNEFSRDQLAFYLANSAFLRRILWNVKETVFDTNKASDYGSPRDGEEGNFYFNSLTSNNYPWSNNSDATEYIEKLLKERG